MLLSFVVPVYNEELTIPIFYKEVSLFKQQLGNDYQIEMIFIDDGSRDNTLKELVKLSQVDPQVKAISFSRNFGKEAALFAGLEYASGDLVVPIDVDLQDPIVVVHEMIAKYNEGYEVVLGKRSDRSTDGFLKKKSAELFYKLHNKISQPKIEENVGDFRLMSRKVVDELIKLKETQLFMKGLFSWVGYPTTYVSYKREVRSAGGTKFNGWKLWNLALEGITSFSTLPLKIWTYLGVLTAIGSFILAIKVIIEKIFYGIAISGYASLMVAILFLGGFTLMGIGVLGEYIGRIYLEVKGRPRYIVQHKFNINK